MHEWREQLEKELEQIPKEVREETVIALAHLQKHSVKNGAVFEAAQELIGANALLNVRLRRQDEAKGES